MKSAIVKPAVTIACFLLGGAALGFAAYRQEHPAVPGPSGAAQPHVSLLSGSGSAKASNAAAAGDEKKETAAKNEVFVVMIEPMFFVGSMNPEALNDAPFITPSKASAPLPEPNPADWVLSTHRLRGSRKPCVR